MSATTEATPSTRITRTRATTVRSLTVVPAATAPAEVTAETGDDLIAALAATPPDDPRRPALRTRTIEAWLGWAHGHIRRYIRGSRRVEDLRQVAALGLIKAVDGYDPERGASFQPYASVTIHGEIKRHFRDQTWDLRVPRRLQELVLALKPVTERLRHELRRAPTVDELAGVLQVPPDDVLEASAASDAYNVISLQTPPASLADNDHELGDLLGQPDPQLESAADRLALRVLFTTLQPRDRTILTMRFYGDKTQREIADELGISQMHVSRLLNATLHRLRAALTSC